MTALPWSVHVVRRKGRGPTVAVVVELPLATPEVARKVAAELDAALTERPGLARSVREAADGPAAHRVTSGSV